MRTETLPDLGLPIALLLSGLVLLGVAIAMARLPKSAA